MRIIYAELITTTCYAPLNRARPVSSSECLEAYEMDAEFHTLSLSDTHSRVMKRGRKSGRAGEYSYSFGESPAVLPFRNKRLFTFIQCSSESIMMVYRVIFCCIDALHLPPAQTTSLYEQNIAPLVMKCMGGFNSTIFAYGQTGSGSYIHFLSKTR